jgi:hypothetical protein
MKKSIVIGLSLLGCFVICAVIYAQVTGNSSISAEEANAEFASVDKNGDGVLSKDEFKTYLVTLKLTKTVTKNVKTEDSCCSGKTAKKGNTEMVDVKFVTETSVKEENPESIDVKAVAETSVKKENSETVDVQPVAEAPKKKACSCCSGKTVKKENTETVDPKSDTETSLKKE